MTLVDDEELELEELQEGPNPLRYSTHLASNGRRGCSLCKDLLARFPPQTVKMKQIFCTRPGDSSPGLVKQLLKDSLLLGIHVALLKLLMLNVEKETTAGFITPSSKICSKTLRYMGSIQIREQDFDVDHWKQSLGPLTWTEILRQVLVAAGLGSKQNAIQRGNYNKERNPMEKYGLHPPTLKGEIFCLLSKQGNRGLKVSELARASQIVELDLPTTEELEHLIYLTLSSDITLFEKIAPSAYRLRVDPEIKGKSDSQSEDSGSVGDDSEDTSTSCSSADSEELDSSIQDLRIVMYKGQHKKMSKKLTVYTEIDESYSGEAWMQGLVEANPSASYTPAFKNANASSSRRGCRSSSSETNNCKDREACNDVHPLQSIFLGSNRRYNNYWLFLGPCSARDPGHRRVYFESSEDGHWQIIDTAQALHALLSILDSRGMREARLVASLEKRKSFLCEAMNEYLAVAIGSRQTKSFEPSDTNGSSGDGSSPTSDVDNVLITSESLDNLSVVSGAINLDIERSSEEKKQKWARLQAFDKWVWNSFYSTLNAARYGERSYMESLSHCVSCHDLFWRDEKHCKFCHTTFEIDFDLEERYALHIATCGEREDVSEFPKHKVLSSQLQVLKAAIHAIEASMPEAALMSTWTTSAHKLWVKRLRRASSLL